MHARWPVPSEHAFNEMGRDDCNGLIEWIESKLLSDGYLTLAVEALGVHSIDKSCELRARKVIKALILHDSPLVREGAVIAAELHMVRCQGFDTELFELIKTRCTDASCGVSKAAEAALQHIEEVRGC